MFHLWLCRRCFRSCWRRQCLKRSKLRRSPPRSANATRAISMYGSLRSFLSQPRAHTMMIQKGDEDQDVHSEDEMEVDGDDSRRAAASFSGGRPASLLFDPVSQKQLAMERVPPIAPSSQFIRLHAGFCRKRPRPNRSKSRRVKWRRRSSRARVVPSDCPR